jgi:hypothetical protein
MDAPRSALITQWMMERGSEVLAGGGDVVAQLTAEGDFRLEMISRPK